MSHDLGADRKNPQTGNKIFTFSLFCVQSGKCKLKVRATFKVSRVAPTCKNHSTLKVGKSWHGASFQPLFLWSCYLNYPVYTNSVFQSSFNLKKYQNTRAAERGSGYRKRKTRINFQSKIESWGRLACTGLMSANWA